MDIEIVILAAGNGSRMDSSLPKPVQKVGGKSLLSWVVKLGQEIEALNTPIIVYQDDIKPQLEAGVIDKNAVRWARQEKQNGTADALNSALGMVKAKGVLVLYADVPLVRAETLHKLLSLWEKGGMAMLTSRPSDTYGYGRVLRDNTNRVLEIVEEREADDDQKQVGEVNAGIVVIDVDNFQKLLPKVPKRNKKELYLTDMVKLFSEAGYPVSTHELADPTEALGANTKAQLHELERMHRQRTAAELFTQGVVIADADRLDVRGDVTAGRDVYLDVNVILQGNIILGDDVSIRAGCVLTDCVIEEGVTIKEYSVLEGVRVCKNAIIGPYARLRPGSEIGEDARVGNFVEIKNATLQKGAKASHLTYIGDAEIGSETNVGAGVITANYDGKTKHKTKIGKDSSIGSNTVLVAPVTLGDNAKIGAGSVITTTVPDNALSVSRTKQETYEGRGTAQSPRSAKVITSKKFSANKKK